MKDSLNAQLESKFKFEIFVRNGVVHIHVHFTNFMLYLYTLMTVLSNVLIV